MGNGITSPAIRYPLLSILIRPQATIRDIVSQGRGASTVLLAAAAGMFMTIAALAGATNQKEFHWFAIIVFGVVAGAVAGIVHVYITSALIRWTGRILGGRATHGEIRAAYAWSMAPYVMLLPLAVAGLLVFQQRFFLEPGVVILGILTLVALCWFLFLMVRTIGAVQAFGVFRAIVNNVLAIVLLLLLVSAIKIFLFQPFSVPAASMEPSILAGDRFLVSKWSYGYSRSSFPFAVPSFGRILALEPQRGDLVVFRQVRTRNGKDEPIDFIKRLVGLPGDEIQMKNGVLFINGQAAQLEHAGDFVTEQGKRAGRYKETLPNGVSHFVLDSEQNSPGDNTAVFKVPAGHYFVLGDSRDNSIDSRFSQIAYVPAESLIGKVVLIYFSVGKISGSESWRHAFDNWRWDRMFVRPQFAPK